MIFAPLQVPGSSPVWTSAVPDPLYSNSIDVEALTGEKTPGQIAKEYGVHPNSVTHCKEQSLEKGPEPFSEDSTEREYERGIRDVAQSLGRKEVEIALSKELLRLYRIRNAEEVALAEGGRDDYQTCYAIGPGRICGHLGANTRAFS
jgi:transposase